MSNFWRLIDTGLSAGSYNMTIDEVLLQAVAAGRSAPVLRFYRWNPPAVSLGYNQSPERELDLNRVREAGIEVVRRITGGRAVLHWDELTYSVIAPDGYRGLASRESSYREIGLALARGLRSFGASVELHRQSPDPVVRPSSLCRSKPPCFASTAKWEIAYCGRKLVGSAQRRIRGAVLQHGSILIGPQHRLLTRLMLDSGVDANNIGSHLQEVVGGPVDLHKLMGFVADGFREQLQLQLQTQSLSTVEVAAIESRCRSHPSTPVSA